jgi:hypothetical protein
VVEFVTRRLFPFFCRSDLLLEYGFCRLLNTWSEELGTAVVSAADLQRALGSFARFTDFFAFLHGTTGRALAVFWLDAERCRCVQRAL